MINFAYLADYKDALPTLISWYHLEWGSKKGKSLDDVAQEISVFCNKNKPPLIIIAFSEKTLLGCIQISIDEMNIYSHQTYWLGGLYVHPTFRNNNVGTLLVQEAEKIAKNLKLEQLYLQTIDLTGGLYSRLSWEKIDIVKNESTKVLVMCKNIE